MAMRCSSQFTVKRISWHEAGGVLRAIRTAVFVREQGVPDELEWDGVDEQCVHALAQTAAGEAIGTGRLLPDGHIGRMAVVKHWRRKGVGGSILKELIAAAVDAGHANVALNAQTHALEFYARFGFEVDGDVFMEAGIPHCSMRLALIMPKRE